MKKILNDLKSLGVYFNPKIERKKVGGIYGMYAKEDIFEKELLVYLPSTHRLSILDIKYPDNFTWIDKYCYSFYKEFQKSFDSKYSYAFQYFEDHKKLSCSFYTEEELKILKNLSPNLYNRILLEKQSYLKKINIFKDFDSTIEEKNLQHIILNYKSRGYQNGFLPIIDLFNHSSTKGSEHVLNNTSDSIYTPVKVKKGDQVYISYGPMDLYEHGYLYNYFDSNDLHLLILGFRIKYLELSTLYKPNFLKLAEKYNIEYYEKDNTIFYNIVDRRIFITEIGFSKILLNFIQDYNSLIGKNKGIQLLEDIINNISQSLNAELKVLSPKLLRYFSIIKKEKEILEKCKKLIID
jgi:hypothetical protein